MSQNKHQCHSRLFSSLLVAALSGILLQGCGGGSSSPSAPPATTLSWSAQQTKTFHFTWNDVSGETGYRLFENPDGASGFTQVGSAIAADSTSYDLVVSLPKRINAQYMLQSCNDTGCTDSNIVSFTDTLVDGIGFLKEQPITNASFGFSVALSADGNTLAVGASGGDGAVDLYTRSGSNWTQTAHLTASNGGNGDRFGNSLALSSDGTVLAVGAYSEDEASTGITAGNYTTNNDLGNLRGAVYLFSNSGSGWVQDYYIKASDSADNDCFGFAVALTTDGTTRTLAVGAIQGGVGNGKVYLFSNSGSGWTEETPVLTASNPGLNDQFGHDIAITSYGGTRTLAVGVEIEDENVTGVTSGTYSTNNDGATDSGAVYLFSDSGSGWAQDAYIKASNTGINDAFGSSVSLSADGSTLVVGAPGESETVTGVYSGPYTTNDDGAIFSGAVYLFSNDGSGWVQDAYIKASNAGANDTFGRSVAISADGSTLVIGADREGSDATGINNTSGTDVNNSRRGAAYLFSHSSGSWVELSYIKASNTSVSTTPIFGNDVALSSNGDTLAVGAPDEDSDVANSGAVYLY